MATLPQIVVAQLKQISLKLREKTIGSPIKPTAVNEPYWTEKGYK